MSDILKRSLAPLTPEAWAAIEEQARDTLSGNLSARRIIDVSGPLGWECAALNLGRLRPGKTAAGVQWALRETQPLVEARVDFTVDLAEMDAFSRGARDADLDPVAAAARKLAEFEETLVYKGFEAGCVLGITGGKDHARSAAPQKSEEVQPAIEKTVLLLQKRGIGGPYHLVLNSALYAMLAAGDATGVSLFARLRELTGGKILWSPVVGKGLLVSGRGGDYELTLGQDVSIGYRSHDLKQVSLYLVESLTFRVLEPAAAVSLA